MAALPKRYLFYLAIAFVLLLIGFMLSSGIAVNLATKTLDKVMPDIKLRLGHHIMTLVIDGAKRYFLFPMGHYTKELYTEPLSFAIVGTILGNSIFNILFQPVFLCPFTPQVILNALLFPFFLYGAFRYLKKTWLMLIIFVVLAFYIGVYDSGVEALIRHGMSCELIYLLIGLAGFTGWITKNSS